VSRAVDAGHRMDAMYRHQRHIYDATRKFYLLGRDGLLDELPAQPGALICELGCGTARNLIRLARRRTEVRLYGIDVSAAMLATATAAVRRCELDRRIQLHCSPIETFDPTAAFGVAAFDTVYFSYVLSMIPDWRRAALRALELVRPGGIVAVVDFADQSRASALRRRALLAWLALFGVHPRPEIARDLVSLATAQDAAARHEWVAGFYAYRLMFRRAA
jgi:S-adenosylmethionine-diacylgycerolhomoserine-N-methlytransferase